MKKAYENPISPEDSELSFGELLFREISALARARGKQPPQESPVTRAKTPPVDVEGWAERQAAVYRPRNPEGFMQLAQILAERNRTPE